MAHSLKNAKYIFSKNKSGTKIDYFSIFLLLFYRIIFLLIVFPANIYLFKVTYKNTRERSEICSKLTIKSPENPRQVFS